MKNPFIKSAILVFKDILPALALLAASAAHGTEFRVQGRLLDPNGDPQVGKVYLSTKARSGSDWDPLVFSPPKTLDAGKFDIRFEIGENKFVALNFYPLDRTPEGSNSNYRNANAEFRVHLDRGMVIIAKSLRSAMLLTEGDPHTWCGVEFSTSHLTSEPTWTDLVPKNDWDGTKGWCPEDVEKLNTTISQTFPAGNLIKNGSFELNPALCANCPWEGWDVSTLTDGLGGSSANWPISEYELVPRTGKKMASIRFRSVAEALTALHSDAFQVKPNTEYTLVFYYYAANAVNWGTDGLRPWIRTYREDRTTRVFDMPFGWEGENPYAVLPEWSSARWSKYTHRFKTGPSAVFARVDLLNATEVGVGADIYFDDVLLVEGNRSIPDYDEPAFSPGTTTVFSDGIGKPIQTRVEERAESAIYSETKYDALWRPVLKTLPVKWYYSNDSYYSIFNSNKYFSMLPEKLEDDYPEADGYPFSEVRYEKTAVGRTIKKSAPGAAWNIDGTHVTENFYSTTSTTNPAEDRPDPAEPEDAKYAYHLLVGENGEMSRTFTDKLGKTIRTSVKSEAGWVNTDYVYDAAGNLSKTIAPPGPNGVRIETEFIRNSLGNVTSEKSPDFGENLFIYDGSNRLRFTQTQAQRNASPSRFSFVKYDAFDRVIESGEYLDVTKFTQFQADLQTFPPRDDYMVKIQGLNFYDRLPENRNYCLDAGFPSTIIIRDDAPAGSSYEFVDWNTAYNYVKSRMAGLSSYSPQIRFIQIFNTSAQAVAPPPGSEYPPFTFSDNVTRKGFTLTGILRGSAEYQQLFQDFPFTLDGKNQDGRLVYSVTCNPALGGTPLGVQQLAKAFNYDKNGNVIEAYEFNGYIRDASKRWQKMAMKYDLGNRVVSKSFGTVGVSLLEPEFFYEYNKAGRLTRISWNPGGGTTEELAEIYYDARGLPNYTYVGPADYEQKLSIDKHYTIRGWLESIEAFWKPLQDPPILQFSEVMNYTGGDHGQFNGNIADITYGFENEVRRKNTYEYDPLNRLTDVSQYGNPANPQLLSEWHYDFHPNGALASTNKNGMAFSYGYYGPDPDHPDLVPTNRLRTVGFTGDYPRDTRASDNFTYDASGRLTTDLSKDMVLSYDNNDAPYKFDYPVGESEASQFMAYNDDSRKSKILYENGVFVSASHYFANGKEIREYYQDGNEVQMEVFPFHSFGRIVHRPEGRQVDYFIRNHLGSTVALQSTSGVLTYKTDYDPYGKLRNESQSTETPVTEKFTGKEHDLGIDLDYFGARFYDPDLGVWSSPDPVRQFQNPYEYAPNPISMVDPDGNSADLVNTKEGYSLESFDLNDGNPNAYFYENYCTEKPTAIIPMSSVGVGTLYKEFVTNSGAELRVLTGGPIVNALINDPMTAVFVREYLNGGPSRVPVGFGPKEFLRASFPPSLSRHFLGGYTLDISPASNGSLNLHWYNRTSLESATRIPLIGGSVLDAKSRGEVPSGGSTYQHYLYQMKP